ncbi:ABC transporter permease [Arcobacteraceae bacterium]|nr:ABC transporter permease [Arcobacteraceae bacterium]
MVKDNKLYTLILLIVLWQIIATILKLNTLPTPIEVLISMYEHSFDGELFYHLGITLYRVFIAFVIAMIIGVFFGILMGRYKSIDKNLDFLLIFGLNLPALVTIILCYIWFGLSDFSAILAVIINKVPTVIVTIREGCKAVNYELLEISKVYRLSRYDTFTKIYLPQIYPYIMASARSGLSLIWKIVLVVELLGRSEGMGFQLSMFFQFFDITSILAYSFSFIIVILLIENFLIQPIERRMTHWRKDA